MRFDGVLAKWNDERGFGFIKPGAGGDEIFVHISEFPKDGQRPRIGERVSFEVALNAEGKKKARRLQCLDRQQHSPSASTANQRGRATSSRGRTRTHSSSRFSGFVVAFVIMCAFAAYTQLSDRKKRSDLAMQPSAAPVSLPAPSTSANTSRFKCDGRTHCSQMTSCEEARFFMNNCPGTKMDGNHDGVPCEMQWCHAGRNLLN